MQIIPTESRRISKTFYTDNIEAWKNFAQRITKNQFVKEFLLNRDGNNCSWCDETTNNNFVIHHISYAHFCTYGIVKEVFSGTEMRPFKTRIVPDCQSCKQNNCIRFNECMDKLVLVHRRCNKEIANHTHDE